MAIFVRPAWLMVDREVPKERERGDVMIGSFFHGKIFWAWLMVDREVPKERERGEVMIGSFFLEKIFWAGAAGALLFF